MGRVFWSNTKWRGGTWGIERERVGDKRVRREEVLMGAIKEMNEGGKEMVWMSS